MSESHRGDEGPWGPSAPERRSLEGLVDRLETAVRHAEVVTARLEHLLTPAHRPGSAVDVTPPPRPVDSIAVPPTPPMPPSAPPVRDRRRPIGRMVADLRVQILFSSIAAAVAVFIVFLLFYGR